MLTYFWHSDKGEKKEKSLAALLYVLSKFNIGYEKEDENYY